MGVDIDLYTEYGDEVLSLRGHYDFFQLLVDQPHQVIEDSSDFYVSSDMVSAVLAGIEGEMKDAGLELPELGEGVLENLDEIPSCIPKDFCRHEPEDWEAALPHYRVLLTWLAAVVKVEYELTCSWSD